MNKYLKLTDLEGQVCNSKKIIQNDTKRAKRLNNHHFIEIDVFNTILSPTRTEKI